MAFTDTKIHQIELLLTLDYLLRFTDDNHFATQIDICKHATNFGLKYDPKASKGNDVRRQRIGDCLKFLLEVTTKFPDEAPFVLEVTPTGKYYIDQKNFLSEEQVIKILAAVKNDKYTQDEDTNFLIERLLDSLSSVYNRPHYLEEVDKLSKGVKKYNLATNRKIRLVNKAYNEKKLITIRYEIYDKNKVDNHIYDCYYRVYKIKEYRNKPYAFLIPISTKELTLFKGFIFDAIENLNIPKGRDKDIVFDDLEENRDLDKWFMEKTKWARKYYDSPSDLLEENKMPISGIAFKTGFYFRKAFLKFVKPSFEEYFSTNLNAIPCASFDTLDESSVAKKGNKGDYIIPHPLKKGEAALYYVVNTFIDLEAFLSWLTSDVHGNGQVPISDMVSVVGPSRINRSLYQNYLARAKSLVHKLAKEEVERIDKYTDRYLKRK